MRSQVSTTFHNEANEWPAHFPADCPPAASSPLDGRVFYLVGSSPPVAEDFESALERDAFRDEPACQRAALSCGLTLEYVLALRKFPRLKKHHVASATLRPEQGRIQATRGRGHHSMWLRADALRAAPSLFEVLP